MNDSKPIHPKPVRKWRSDRHNVYMSNGIVFSQSDAKKILGVLEFHICSNLVNEAPANIKDRLQAELQELNKIQKAIEEQLNVPVAR